MASQASAAVVLNSSESVNFNVTLNNEVARYNSSGLDLNSNKVFNYFASKCSSGKVVEKINADGTYSCVDPTEDTGVENLNETLTAGNEANQSIDFMGNDIVSASTTNLDLKTSGNVEVPNGYVNISSGDLNVSGEVRVLDGGKSSGTRLIRVGDDAFLTDVDSNNRMGIYGESDSSVGEIQLGSAGAVIQGTSNGDVDIHSGNLRLTSSDKGIGLKSGTSGNERYGLKYGSADNIGNNDNLMLTNREVDGDLLLAANDGTGGQEAVGIRIHGGDSTPEVEIPNGDLNVSGNTLRFVGGLVDSSGTACGDDQFVDGNGNCQTDSTGSSTTNVETLNETLLAGDIANQSIRMNGNDVVDTGNLRFDGNVTIGNSGTFTEGTQSLAIGRGAEMNATNTIGIGRGIQATDKETVIIGDDSRKGGDSTGKHVIIGFSASGGVSKSTAVGDNADSGQEAVAIGQSADSGSGSNKYGTAVGYQTSATPSASVALGYTADAEGTAATALGPKSNASAGTSVALGHRSKASGSSAVAIGHEARSPGAREVTLGALSDPEDDGVSDNLYTLNVTGNVTVHGIGNVTLKSADLDLGGNGLRNVGSTECPSNEAILGDGSCGAPADADADSTNELQTLNETLLQGNEANQTIDMMDNNIDGIGTLNSGGALLTTGGHLNLGSNRVNTSQSGVQAGAVRVEMGSSNYAWLAEFQHDTADTIQWERNAQESVAFRVRDETDGNDIFQVLEDGSARLGSGTASPPNSVDGHFNVTDHQIVTKVGEDQAGAIQVKMGGGSYAALANFDHNTEDTITWERNANNNYAFFVVNQNGATDLLRVTDSGDLEVPNGNVNLSFTGNVSQPMEIKGFFASACSGSDVVDGINSDGSYSCVDASGATDDLNATLEAGNEANQTIDMMDNNIDQVKEINSGGETVKTGGSVNVTSGSITSAKRMCIGDRCT